MNKDSHNIYNNYINIYESNKLVDKGIIREDILGRLKGMFGNQSNKDSVVSSPEEEQIDPNFNFANDIKRNDSKTIRKYFDLLVPEDYSYVIIDNKNQSYPGFAARKITKYEIVEAGEGNMGSNWRSTDDGVEELTGDIGELEETYVLWYGKNFWKYKGDMNNITNAQQNALDDLNAKKGHLVPAGKQS